uniref:Solute carrier family 41 member n=1 Tax=Pygocentrus nattereri TaxID=42514 RepID=A0A3B4CG17_PYGNA
MSDISSLWGGRSDRSSGVTQSVSSNIEKEHSESDPLLPNGRLWSSMASEIVPLQCEEQRAVDGPAMHNESVCATVLQSLVPFHLAVVQVSSLWGKWRKDTHWKIALCQSIFILVPALLGLKGNLEMMLALRLSTVQATVLGFLAVLTLVINYAALLCCSSVVTSFTASLLQSIIMVGVIIVSKRAGINLDNIAIPIAASFGDLITLGSSNLALPLYFYMVRVLFLCLTPVWVIISLRHPESRRLLYCSCKPIITAMVTSSLGGLILDRAMTDPNLMGVVLYIPIINGVGGNLVPLQSSHIATYLHFYCSLGELPEHTKGCYCLSCTFYGKDPDSFAIPYLTALRDLLGTALLFHFLCITGRPFKINY